MVFKTKNKQTWTFINSTNVPWFLLLGNSMLRYRRGMCEGPWWHPSENKQNSCILFATFQTGIIFYTLPLIIHFTNLKFAAESLSIRHLFYHFVFLFFPKTSDHPIKVRSLRHDYLNTSIIVVTPLLHTCHPMFHIFFCSLLPSQYIYFCR